MAFVSVLHAKQTRIPHQPQAQRMLISFWRILYCRIIYVETCIVATTNPRHEQCICKSIPEFRQTRFKPGDSQVDALTQERRSSCLLRSESWARIPFITQMLSFLCRTTIFPERNQLTMSVASDGRMLCMSRQTKARFPSHYIKSHTVSRVCRYLWSGDVRHEMMGMTWE